MKKIAILQSNYIPWKGYFDLIASVDEFIVYDDMQYTKRDWRNRNKIKTPQGVQWLTIPVLVKGKYFQKIKETEIQDSIWAQEHWKTLEQNYGKAKYFNEISEWLSPLYLENESNKLSLINISFIQSVCKYLEIKTIIKHSWDYPIIDGKTERLVDLCKIAGGTEYVSGPSAKSYIDEKLFQHKNIKLTWFNYMIYPEYPQLWGAFVHEVTILDLLFNCGEESSRFFRSINK